jgi:tRNA C32,U32 (ribose-2'-O)-methylase TrmJ
VAPTRETAAKILRQVDPREEEPQAVRNASRSDAQARTIAKLENEIADLRAKLAKTVKERDAALKRCADLSKQLSAAKRR